MSSKFSFFKKNWIMIWLIVAALFFAGIITYAAYTRITIAKRVVSTGQSSGIPFASDVLKQSGRTKRASYSQNNVDPIEHVYIFNYPYPRKSSYGREETIYDLTVSLGTLNNNEFIALSGTELADLSNKYKIVDTVTGEEFVFGTTENGVRIVEHTFEGRSIAGGNYNSYGFDLYFDPAELTAAVPKGYCMKLIATPADSEYPTLEGCVMVRYSETDPSGWWGELEPLDSSDEYDGYNYILKGIGTGKLTFRWNADEVTINQQFLHNKDVRFYIGGTYLYGNDSLSESDLSTNNGMTELTVCVDSTHRSRYDIQFYKVKINPSEHEYDNENISNYIPKTLNADWVKD